MDNAQPQKGGLRYRKKSKAKAPAPPALHGSDSDGSADSNSLSGDSQYASRPSIDRHKSVTKKGEWEILSGLKQGQRFDFTPNKFEGYLLKRRKWPLKGWHKRYLVLEESVLTYGKTAADLLRGKQHGSMDIGMSVISTKASRRRIDIDADTSIVHLKCQSRETYMQWVEQLKQHRLRKQHQLLYSTQPPALPPLLSPSDDSPTEPLSARIGGGGVEGGAGGGGGGLCPSLPGSGSGTLRRDAVPLPAGGGPGGSLRPWLVDSSALDNITDGLVAANSTLQSLTRLHLHLQHQHLQQADPATPSSTKTRRKFRLRKHKISKSGGISSQDIVASVGPPPPPLHASPVPPTAAAVGGLACPHPPSLVHQCSLSLAGDRTSTRSEDITRAMGMQGAEGVGAGNLCELRPLSSSNPALSHSSPQHPSSSHPPTTPQFFPPSYSHCQSRPQSCSDAASSSSTNAPPLCPSPNNLGTSAATLPQVSSLPLLPALQQGGSAPPSAPPSISLDSRYAGDIGNGKESMIRVEDLTVLAKELLSQLSSLYRCLATERDRLQQAVESSEEALLVAHSTAPTAIVAALRGHLSQAVQQNAELRARLARIHADADLSGLGPSPAGDVEAVFSSPTLTDLVHKTLAPSLSYESSSCFSASEYFDAPGDGGSRPLAEDEDANNSDSSSDLSTPASVTTSDASDAATETTADASDLPAKLNKCFTDRRTALAVSSKCFTGRRTALAAPQPNKEDFSLFNFLYKNIGKDLSKVSIPITINEPLNMLQRLCEELEYSELLDKAASLRAPDERMVQVAAFAVSAYASSIHRAAHKPFNPLLGETFEAIRDDKGFKFVAEQVSHHPPVSACHAQGTNFVLWQDMRIKTKFWGKSLEFQPSGTVHLTLHQHNDVYEWNKVTSCVHNLFGGGTRWVDQYGEAVIKNTTYGLTCTLNFVKASSWSSKRHEVFGTIVDASGTVLHNLFGKWTEALYCGHAPSARVVWRPGSMPENSHLYFGFTRFAIELNELLPDQAQLLPPTDTRFRPDQRMLEEGRVEEAEETKQALELQQRERRRDMEAEGAEHLPMWFRREESVDACTADGGEESWKFNGEYWNKRKMPGFANMSFERLW